MEHFGFWSLFPPLIAIILAIKTRQVFISLFFGIWLGWVILSDFNFLTGTLASIQALVDVFKDAGNTRTIMFSSLVGALIAFIQRSGGVEGFIKYINKYLSNAERHLMHASFLIIFLSVFYLGVSFYFNNLQIVSIPGGVYKEALIGYPKHINPLYSGANDLPPCWRFRPLRNQGASPPRAFRQVLINKTELAPLSHPQS